MSDYSRAKQEYDAIVSQEEYAKRIVEENKKLTAKIKRLQRKLKKLKEKSK